RGPRRRLVEAGEQLVRPRHPPGHEVVPGARAQLVVLEGVERRVEAGLLAGEERGLPRERHAPTIPHPVVDTNLCSDRAGPTTVSSSAACPASPAGGGRPAG